mgnify:CR=1 FL=1
MGYTHLTKEERYQIRAMLEMESSIREMANVLDRAPSTISRELRRNRGQRGYRPGQADQKACERARTSRTRARITVQDWAAVAALVRQDWSPEQISGRMRCEGRLSISPEWIYQFVYADKATGGDLCTHLRCQHKRRKRYGSGRERRGRIPDRVGIEKRPAGVESRSRIGHWEGDTIIGKGHRGAAVTLVERKSRFLRIGKLPGKSAKATQLAIQRRLSPMAERVQTLTLDNGKEFSRHQTVARALDAAVFFADPYASWQRGTNENTNGLIRQYLPKHRDLSTLTGAEVREIEKRINNRPRKCLDYRTPHEVFNKTHEKLTVALRG